MVNTKEMLPDEYSHYVLRYSAIQSGYADHNRNLTIENVPDEVGSILKMCYTDMFYAQMARLRHLTDDRRVNALDHMIQTIERYDFANSLGAHGANGNPKRTGRSASERKQIVESSWD